MDLSSDRILNECTADNMLAVSVYVGFRKKHPDKATMRRVLRKLQDNNIEVSLFVEWKTDHCQQTESSKDEGSSEYRHCPGVVNGKQPLRF